MEVEKYIDQFFTELQHTPEPWTVKPEHQMHLINFSDKFVLEYEHGVYPNEAQRNEINANVYLMSCSAEMLRTICRTYLVLLHKFQYGQNDFCSSARISLNPTLAHLRNQIASATGLDCQYIQERFEGYVMDAN